MWATCPRVGVLTGLLKLDPGRFAKKNDSRNPSPSLIKGWWPPYSGCLCSVPEVHISRPQVWCVRADVGSSKVPIEDDPPAILSTCMV